MATSKTSNAKQQYNDQSITSLKGAERVRKRPAVIVGSEGGFSPEEAEAAREAGLTPVNLGPRILRCETAPAYVLSSISYHFEL